MKRNVELTQNRTGIVIQVRMASTRLPGKAMLPLVGKPVLLHLLDRLKEVQTAELIVATTVQPEDNVIEHLCRSQDIACLRGDEEDVLSRYVTAAQHYQLEIIVRITGDCPLMDPLMVAKMIQQFQQNSYDYYSNLRPRTFPRGLDCEIFTRDLLQKAFDFRKPDDCPEYVVIPYVNRHENFLRTGNYSSSENYADLRWTLDEQADFKFIQAVYEALYPQKRLFLWHDILKWIEKNPEMRALNAHVRHKSI